MSEIHRPEIYWQHPRPDHTSPLPDAVDVAVVGAGFAGLSIALDLLAAAPGLRVAVLESHHAGFGASGRNAGAVLPLAVLPWLVPGSAGGHDPAAMQQLLHARVGRRVQELRAALPAAEIRPVRMLLMATNRIIAAGLGWVGDTVTQAGIGVERWSGSDATAASGAPAKAAIALDAWTIQPAALATALAARLVDAGGSLHEGAAVATVTPGAGGVELTLRCGKRLRAGHAVIATGAYTGELAVPDAPRAEAVHTYMQATEPGPALPGDLFFSAPGFGMAYWRGHGGRLVFGGTDVAGLRPGPTADALPRAHRGLDRLRGRLLPADRRPPVHRWGGPMHVTPSEVPHLAASAASPRIVYALGFAGSGVALTLSAGPLVRDLVLGAAAADPEAVLLRQAINATRIPWRGLLATVRPAAAHLLRGLAPARS